MMNAMSGGSNRRTFGLAVWAACAVVGLAGAAPQQVGGSPLLITCDDDATIGVARPLEGAASAQYYAVRAKGSALFLDGTNTMLRWGNGMSTFALWDDAVTGRFAFVSSSMPSAGTIQTVVRAGDSGVDIRQTVTYDDGRPYYDIRWDIMNVGQQTFSDARFFHGGDVSPYGEDYVPRGGWDASSNLVYVVAQDGRMMGLQGVTPPSSYYEAHFQLARDACKAGTLPGKANGSTHDAAYALQWNRETLGPEETWTITAREMWSGAGIPEEEGVWTNITPYLASPLFAWELNRQTGTYFGDVTISNLTRESADYFTGPFWCVLNSSEIRRYWPQASGMTPEGLEYTNLTMQVESALGDGRLDPGDAAVVPGIQVYMRYREPPPDSAFTIWATRYSGARR